MLAKIQLFSILYLNFFTVFGVNLPTNCGKSKVNDLSDWRIVGGKNALSGEFPWQIILTRKFVDELGQQMMELCGGTIVNNKWILTAAHCVAESSDASTYEVQLGVHEMGHSEGGELRANVEKVIHHESYSKATVSNDIGLVKLRGTLDFTGKHTNLEPICLATKSTQLSSNCVATGFGYRNAQGLQAKVLQKVSEPIASASHCERIHRYFNSKHNICAGGLVYGGSGTCMGDSGGPLQCESSDGTWYQAGITSYGIPCAKPNDPDVFTSVAAYLDWIKTTIDEN